MDLDCISCFFKKFQSGTAASSQKSTLNHWSNKIFWLLKCFKNSVYKYFQIINIVINKRLAKVMGTANCWYIKIHSPQSLSPPKVTPNLKSYFLKIFSIKQKTNEILPGAIEEIKFCLVKKTSLCSFRL